MPIQRRADEEGTLRVHDGALGSREKDETAPAAATWAGPEMTTLSEVTQTTPRDITQCGS